MRATADVDAALADEAAVEVKIISELFASILIYLLSRWTKRRTRRAPRWRQRQTIIPDKFTVNIDEFLIL